MKRPTRYKSKTAEQAAVKRTARLIADRLLTVSYGSKHAEKGTRLAVMKGEIPNEKHLGGWCRSAAEREIVNVLKEQLKAQRDDGLIGEIDT